MRLRDQLWRWSPYGDRSMAGLTISVGVIILAPIVLALFLNGAYDPVADDIVIEQVSEGEAVAKVTAGPLTSRQLATLNRFVAETVRDFDLRYDGESYTKITRDFHLVVEVEGVVVANVRGSKTYERKRE